MSKSKYTIDDLPELPLEVFESFGELRPSGTAPILTIVPDRPAAPKPPAAPTPLVPTSEFVTRKYLVQVTYPRLVCYPISEVPDEIVLDRPARPDRSDLALTAKAERFYKLSAHPAAAHGGPSFCSVKYGPWSAVAIEETSCTFGAPNHWLLFIVEIPQVELEWYGSWEDIPPFPGLHVIMGTLSKIQEGSACCPGYRWCSTTGSCIDITIKCPDDPSPV